MDEFLREGLAFVDAYVAGDDAAGLVFLDWLEERDQFGNFFEWYDWTFQCGGENERAYELYRFVTQRHWATV